MPNEIELTGCTPEPLMGYLKALGVFRLVAEQKDSNARLSWRCGNAVLHTELDREELVRFFGEDYVPTPIMVPWSGGDFFGVDKAGTSSDLKKTPTASKIIQAFLTTNTGRLESYRTCLLTVFDVMERCGVQTKADIEGPSKKQIKSNFIDRLRSELPDAVLHWIDCAAQADSDGTTFNPLIGSGGGSDGNTHFSDNFMQSLWECLSDFDSQRKDDSIQRPSVKYSLFCEPGGILSERTGALYDSGAVGGPNATQGFNRGFQVNPWDFILALEGTQCFAGGIAKRHGSFSEQSPSFPFLAQMAAAGFSSSVIKEYGQHEIWLPLWGRPFGYAEHQQLMREGRVQLGRRPARSGTDFARSVRTLGVSAGIDAFHRYGLIRGRVGGENYFTASSLGIYPAAREDAVTLLEQLDRWLTKFNFLLRDDKVPARYQAAFRRLDLAIHEACKSVSDIPLLPVLKEVGQIERTLSGGLAFAAEKRISPIADLQSRWLKQTYDDSPEFRLAASLAGIRRTPSGDIGPIRVHLEEVEVTKYVNWSSGSTSAVWSKQSLAKNLAAVFRRRQLEAFRCGIEGVPINSPCFARLDDVLAFLNDETDDEKLAELLWGLICVEIPSEQPWSEPTDQEVPVEFGLPRLLVNSWQPGGGESVAKHDPDVFNHLATGRSNTISECVTRAARRLKSGGLIAIGYRNRRHSGQRLSVVSNIDPTRLLAAMLFPLSNRALNRIAQSVLYPAEMKETSHVD